MSIYVEKKPWWSYLPNDIQESIKLSLHLADESSMWAVRFHDYSFIVFPAAKAYEGFLKKIFLDLGLITEEDYTGKRFRIGRALNPEIDERHRGDDWVYGKLIEYCNGEALPEKLWNTWREARNLLFHWFPKEKNVVNHNEAVEKLLMIIDAIDEVFSICEIDISKRKRKNE